jgi:hypothetical protein
MHTQGGRLSGIRITGQMLIFSNGLNPPVANAKLIFLGSSLNLQCVKSKCFYAGESAGCLNFASLVLSLQCRVIYGAGLEHMKSLLTLGFSLKCLITF